MADVLAGMRTYLAAQSAVSSLVSSRCYFSVLPQKATLPAVVLLAVGSEYPVHLATNSALARVTVQLDCYAASYAAAVALGEAVRGVLQHYTGTMGSLTVRDCQIDNAVDVDDQPLDGTEAWRYIRSLSVYVWHTI